jgi:membrane protease YdiL (CAAX protease family)
VPELAPSVAPDAGAWPRWAVAYVPTALVQVALAVYVSRVGRPRSALAGLVGRTWRTGRDALFDLVIAALLACAIEAVEVVCARWSVPSLRASSLVPASMAERLAWIPLATCIGVSEELVYRGYLRAQLTAFTGRAWMGIVLQALLFGVAHLDQGFAFAARACVYGVGLGVVARARGSLVPGMICHVGVDLVGGLLVGLHFAA